MDYLLDLVDFLLYLAVPLFVVGIGVLLLRSDQSRRYIGVVSNRTLGFLAIAVGAVDLVVRLLRVTVLR